MAGGDGADVFLFTALTDTGRAFHDVIRGFVSGTDLVSFTGLGLSYVEGAFTGANQIRWDAGTSALQTDVDGDGVFDRQVVLTGVGAGFVAATDLLV